MRTHCPADLRKRLLCQLILSLMLSWSNVVWADIVLVVHPDNPLRTLDTADARRIFLKKTSEFPDGNRVQIAILNSHSDTRRVFESQVLKMSASQIKSYWAGFIFTGQNSPPPEFPSENALKQWIAVTPGALGYLDINEVDDTVKVLATIASEIDR